MVVVVGEQPSLVHQFLSELRDVNIQRDRSRFRNNLLRLGQIMSYEISKKLPSTERQVTTPLGHATVATLMRDPVLLTIMRAGLPYFSGFQSFFDHAESGFVGAYRKENEETLTIQLDYLATPDLAGREVILIDPMLASGRSVIDTISQLTAHGMPAHIHFASVVAAPEGIRYVQNHCSFNHTIWTFAVDEKLNSRYYIVPGLGDAGDLSFGSKVSV